MKIDGWVVQSYLPFQMVDIFNHACQFLIRPAAFVEQMDRHCQHELVVISCMSTSTKNCSFATNYQSSVQEFTWSALWKRCSASQRTRGKPSPYPARKPSAQSLWEIAPTSPGWAFRPTRFRLILSLARRSVMAIHRARLPHPPFRCFCFSATTKRNGRL